MSPAADIAVQRIGRYEVRGELGTGGMAVVYRAHDPRLERDVAVKVLHPHLARDPESRARFEREARAAARLRHPNIVEVYEFSDPEERESYMVTELLEGPTLRRFAERHPDVPAEVAAAVGVVLCDALACAHAQGVVHRDVKPDNLMLQRGQVKLTDFGIAHVADGRGMTVTGQVLGSPAHMAPEQIEGSAVDARTDVFAAGTVLYQLAVGRLPFEGTTAHALLRKILEGQFTDAARAAPKVGHRFAAVLAKALARDPEARYPSAEALRADLCAFLKEAGWDAPDKELRAYFEDPEAVVAALHARLKERLPALGEQCQREGRNGEAMGYFNRALALDPGNVKVLALVRRASRRRQIARVARAGAIVGAVATATAVAAVLLIEPRVPPKPASVAVAPEAALPEPTPVLPRAVQQPRAVPPAPTPDAPEVAAAPEPEAPHPRHTPAEHRPAATSLPAAMQAVAAARRALVLHPVPQAVEYSLDGRTWTTFSSQRPTIGEFPVGQRVRVIVRPLGDLPYERWEWEREVPEGVTPYDLPLARLATRRASPDARAAATDASVPRLN
ncbi:MAG: protein kinase [Polyangiales bacterium]